MSDGLIGLIFGMALGIHAGIYITFLVIAWPSGSSWRSILPRGTSDEQDDERRDD